jgi:hypothetical protein
VAQNLLDDALSKLPTAPVIAPPKDDEPNEFSGVVAEMAADRERRLRSNVRQAAETTPDRHAQVMRYAEMSGLPAEVIERSFADVEKEAKTNAVPYQQLFQQNPKLAQWLSADPSNTAVASDDIEPLGAIEKTLTVGANSARALGSSLFSG